MLKTKDDNPSIGILLCNEKNKVKAEYALKDINIYFPNNNLISVLTIKKPLFLILFT